MKHFYNCPAKINKNIFFITSVFLEKMLKNGRALQTLPQRGIFFIAMKIL